MRLLYNKIALTKFLCLLDPYCDSRMGKDIDTLHFREKIKKVQGNTGAY